MKPLAGVRVCVAEFVERRVFQAVRVEEAGKSIGDRVRLNVRAVLIAADKRAADAVARFVGVQLVVHGGGKDERAAAVLRLLRLDDGFSADGDQRLIERDTVVPVVETDDVRFLQCADFLPRRGKETGAENGRVELRVVFAKRCEERADIVEVVSGKLLRTVGGDVDELHRVLPHPTLFAGVVERRAQHFAEFIAGGGGRLIDVDQLLQHAFVEFFQRETVDIFGNVFMIAVVLFQRSRRYRLFDEVLPPFLKQVGERDPVRRHGVAVEPCALLRFPLLRRFTGREAALVRSVHSAEGIFIIKPCGIVFAFFDFDDHGRPPSSFAM